MLCEFKVAPFGASESVSKDVAEIIEIIEESGLSHQTHAMGTLIEGDWDEVFMVIRKCHEKMRQNNRRVITDIHIDDRQGAVNRLTGKIESLEQKLGRSIKK